MMASERFLRPSSYLEQLSSGVARLFGDTMRRLLDNVETRPPTTSAWDQLMASSSPEFYYIAVAEKISLQKGALIASLFEFAPRLQKYLPAQPGNWFGGRGYYPQGFVGLNYKNPTCFMSAAEVASSGCRPPLVAETPLTTVTLVPVIIPPLIMPTIVVTDVDGPQRCDSYDLQVENFKAMRFGQGLLWREWRGKFSPPSQLGGEVESGDEMYFEDQLHEEVGDSLTKCRIELRDGTCRNPDDQIRGSEPTIQEAKEWWEIGSEDEDEDEGEDEGEGEDEDEGIEEDPDSDQDNEDSNGDSDDDEFSGSEDGDDEHEDGSDGDDSGEDSDFDEESELDMSSSLGPETLMPLLQQKKSILLTLVQSQTGEFGSSEQDLEANEGNSDASRSSSSSSSSLPYLSVMDSDFESCNSWTTMSSLSPTPITPASPFLVPLDDCVLQRHYSRLQGGGSMSELWLAQKPYRSMICLDLALRSTRRAKWELERGYEDMVPVKVLDIEGLDLAGWNSQKPRNMIPKID